MEEFEKSDTSKDAIMSLKDLGEGTTSSTWNGSRHIGHLLALMTTSSDKFVGISGVVDNTFFIQSLQKLC